MNPSALGGGAMIGVGIFYLAVVVVLGIIPVWRIFSKAGKPGWAAIVPIYNIYMFCKICGRPGWWLLLCLVPIVNFVIAIILCIDLAKAFGKSSGFAIGIILLSIIFIPILGYGKAAYIGGSEKKPA
jgi:hypothetical protein